MLLDVSILRLLGKDDFRVLRAVELGMRNVSGRTSSLVPRGDVLGVARNRPGASDRAGGPPETDHFTAFHSRIVKA